MDVGQGQLTEPCKSGVLIAFIISALLSLLGCQNYPLVNILGLALTNWYQSLVSGSFGNNDNNKDRCREIRQKCQLRHVATQDGGHSDLR